VLATTDVADNRAAEQQPGALKETRAMRSPKRTNTARPIGPYFACRPVAHTLNFGSFRLKADATERYHPPGISNRPPRHHPPYEAAGGCLWIRVFSPRMCRCRPKPAEVRMGSGKGRPNIGWQRFHPALQPCSNSACRRTSRIALSNWRKQAGPDQDADWSRV